MTIEFCVPGPPRAKAKRITTRGGRPRGYLDRDTQAYQEMVCRAALEARPPDWPPDYRGPVEVCVVAVFPRPARLCRVSRRDDTRLLGGISKGRVLYTRRPDLDNVIKSVLDGLKWAGVIHDDAQVVSIDGSRRWYAAMGEVPHTEVRVSMATDTRTQRSTGRSRLDGGVDCQ